MLMYARLINVILVCVIMSGCGVKRSFIGEHATGNRDIKIFIELPQNDLVFENVTPLLYDICTEHFDRLGYELASKPTDGYTVSIIIKSLEPVYKYISPDVVLFHTMSKLELVVKLLNYRKEVVTQKNFSFSTLIPNSHNPVLTSDFLEFTYSSLFKNAAAKIELYIRPFLVERVSEL